MGNFLECYVMNLEGCLKKDTEQDIGSYGMTLELCLKMGTEQTWREHE